MTLIVGIGGTTSATSSCERVLGALMERCAALGAETRTFGGGALDLPFYAYGTERTPDAIALIEAMRAADAIAIVSPGYHGTISGLLKNALDYAEDLARDPDPYLHGRPIGLVAVAAGWQATGSTLAALRSIAHALRGWPTPLGIAVNSALPVTNADGAIADPALAAQLALLAEQMTAFPARRLQSA